MSPWGKVQFLGDDPRFFDGFFSVCRCGLLFLMFRLDFFGGFVDNFDGRRMIGGSF